MKYLLLLLFLLGCSVAAPPKWVPNERATASSDFAKDSYECERDKRSTNFRESYESSRNFLNEGIWQRRADQFYARCMELRGWKQEQQARTKN